jgi:hypothetical protein
MCKKLRVGGKKILLQRISSGHLAAASRWLAIARRPRAGTWIRQTMALFWGFFFLVFFGKFEEWAMPFGRMGVRHSQFFKLAPHTWEGEIFHSSGTLEIIIFPILFFC